MRRSLAGKPVIVPETANVEIPVPDACVDVEARSASRFGSQGLSLTLPLPPSTNNLYATVLRRGKPIRVKSREGKAFDAIVAHRVLHWVLERGRFGDHVPHPPYRLDIRIFPKDRRRDVSNFVKATEDAVFAAINRNDRLVVDVRARMFAVDKDNPRAEVLLEHVEEEAER